MTGWATMFKELYTDFLVVLKYHLFESTDIEFVSMKVGDGHAEEVANLKFPKEEEDHFCAEGLETLLPSILNSPGLKEIKMVELLTQVPSLSEANQHGQDLSLSRQEMR
jgi:hypothetical protein